MWLSAIITKSSCFVTAPVTGELQGNIFLKTLPKPTKISRKSVILDSGVWKLVCYLFRWNKSTLTSFLCSNEVTEAVQHMQNICFPIQLLKTAPIFLFQGQEFTSVCRDACVHRQREKTGCNSFRSIRSLIQADFPKEQLLWAAAHQASSDSKAKCMWSCAFLDAFIKLVFQNCARQPELG